MFGKNKNSQRAEAAPGKETLERLRELTKSMGSLEAAMKAQRIDIDDYIEMRGRAGGWNEALTNLKENEISAAMNARFSRSSE